jgi:Arc/MetJ-type ribon-helix-helix transcriptional regulator
MVIGMATVKVTITLEESQLEQIRALVEDGAARSVSGFVQHAVATGLDDAGVWAQLLDEALEETGGPLTKKEIAWAEDVIGVKPRKRRRSGVA